VKHKRIAVIGAGISGLTAAYYLAHARRGGAPLEEYLFEASDRLGGVMRTEQIEGCLVEAGPDAFLTEKNEALVLCQRLGLVAQLIGSEDHQRRTLILRKGKLVPLPDGFEFMVPTRPLSVLGTPLLSLGDKLALAAEVLRRPGPTPRDESVAAFVQRHFSRGLLESIVEPLLTAVYGGDASRLSVQSTLPRLAAMEKEHGSLIRAMRHAARQRKQQAGAQPGQPVVRPPLFTTLRDGLETLVVALRMNLEEQRILCQRRLTAVKEEPSGGFRLHIEGAEDFHADAVILALPARETAHLLRELDADMARSLLDIHYSSSVIVALGYDAARVKPLPAGFGFLVPQKEGGRVRACSFVGHKFAGRVPPNRVLLRCFLGGMQDEAVLQSGDKELTATVRAELEGILGITAEPLFASAYRWPKAMAQYTVGHQQRLADIHARLSRHRGLFLAGNAYEGIGIPDCIRSGRLAAEVCVAKARRA
jgi:oxygen-dependent protoporphyrinogen oxidase